MLSFITAIVQDELKIVLRYGRIFHQKHHIKTLGEAFLKVLTENLCPEKTTVVSIP